MSYKYTTAAPTKKDPTKRSINSVQVFIDALEDAHVLEIRDFVTFFNKAESLILEEYKATTGALSNVRGAWYENLVTLGAMEYSLSNSSRYHFLQLPNVSTYDAGKLYKKEYFEYISDLRKKVLLAANVSLVTSNPDFVILNKKVSIVYPNFSGKVKSHEDISLSKNLYLQAEHKCEFEDIAGYIGVKTSLRPDRRLQLPHEGSLLKALYRHIQTRDWMLDAVGLKYFCVAMKYSKADRVALKTVATHSVVTVSSKPESAVDELYTVTSGADLRRVFDEISKTLNLKT